jgi:hypothetical protein
MNKETILGIVRHVLTFGGGFLVTKGLADAGEVTELVGAVAAILGVVWSILDKRAKKSAA